MLNHRSASASFPNSWASARQDQLLSAGADGEGLDQGKELQEQQEQDCLQLDAAVANLDLLTLLVPPSCLAEHTATPASRRTTASFAPVPLTPL